MFGIENYALFVLTGILLNLTPGSDTIYILSRTIAQGKMAGIVSVLGIISGAVVHTLFAALGLTIILMQSSTAFTVVKWIGAAYLIYLGIKSIMTKANIIEFEQQHAHNNMGKIFIQGFLTNVLNPKVALFFLAFLPQFISKSNEYGALPFILLGLTFIATGSSWCLILVLLSDFMSKSIRKSKLAIHLNKVTGAVLVVLGLNLLRTNRGTS
ncbi:LysE family translocator [Paenibacillus alkalitolerans]|uniref:LysE family translocator n=1 Tax=Paenibacillus alkalitolerans TaxID=2799335 RepID=UPI0018F75799|nr:LysE family translocator [Paenibacillus alkalitolerans]